MSIILSKPPRSLDIDLGPCAIAHTPPPPLPDVLGAFPSTSPDNPKDRAAKQTRDRTADHPRDQTTKQARDRAAKQAWDRVSLVAVPVHDPRFREETMELRLPLPHDSPDGCELIGTIVIYAVEILLGHRPSSDLRQWLAPDVFAPLARRAGLAYRIRGKAPRVRSPRILRTFANRPLARAVEAVAAVHDGERVRAACVRLEYLRGRWRAVALEIG